MALFSSRQGLVKPPPRGDSGELGDHLRTALWNDFYHNLYKRNVASYGIRQQLQKPMADFFHFLWSEYLGCPGDEYPGHQKMVDRIKSLFLSEEWFVPLDLLELVYDAAPHLGIDRSVLELQLNDRLDAANAAYSFVEGKFIDRVSDVEKAAIEQAFESPSDAVQKHLREAFRLLSDRQDRGYANSVKESISAVEAACQRLLGKNKATLSAILRTSDQAKSMHPALRDAFVKLYGWTSDDGGIRHAMGDGDQPPGREEAHFMLVACSAFVNYLFSKFS